MDYDACDYIINEKGKGFVKSSKDIRQGDPIPIFFQVMDAQSQSRELNKVFQEGKNGTKNNDLHFINDMLFS